MAWSSYSRQPDGRVRFVDDAGGELLLVDSPAVDAQMREIDARSAPPAPMTPAPMPDGIAVASSGPMTTSRAQMVALPPGPVVNVAPPAPGSPLVPPPAAGTAAPPPPPPPPPAGGAPAPQATAGVGQQLTNPPPKIVRSGAGAGIGDAEDRVKGAQAQLLIDQANEELRGSPGRFVPGGTFPTGRTEQFTPGPDPLATADREDAERRLVRHDDALTWVEAHRQQDLGDAAQAEAARAAERQRQMEELQARQAEKLGGVLGEIDAKRKELADSRLDPDRLLASMSTGQQALAAIGLALGSFGKAMSGDEGEATAMRMLDEAIRTDLDMQRFAIEQKRGDLNTLGEIYRLTREQFGDERMAQEAAYLAGLEIYKAKIQKIHAEADAALGVETQYDEEGKIIAGAPYSIKAQRLLAALEVEQARLRESLSQQANGQVAQQYVTTQDRVEGGKAPNRKKAADLLGEAAKAMDGGGQQVTYDGQKYRMGSFVEQGEGKALRSDLGGIENLKADIALLEKELKDHPIDSKTFNKSKVQGLMERVSSKANVVLGQGAKNNDEAKRWESILGGVMTNGVGAVQDMSRWADDMAKRKLDQVNARPAGQGPSVRMPQELTDKVEGKRPVGGGGGVVGLPRQAAPARPPSPVARTSGATASPLDRAGAAVVQLRTAKDDKAQAKVRATLNAALNDSLRAGQLGSGEYTAAKMLADAGDVDGLLGFLGRMRSAPQLAGTSPAPSPASQEEFNRRLSAQMMTRELERLLERLMAPTNTALQAGPVTTSIVTTTGTAGKKGKAPAAPQIKATKFTSLSGKKGK